MVLGAIVSAPEIFAAVQEALPTHEVMPAHGAPPDGPAWSGLVSEASPEALARSRRALLATEEPTAAQIAALGGTDGALVVSPLVVPLARMLAGRAAGAFATESS